MRYSSVKSLHISVKNQACSGTGRLSKGSLLSMMGYRPFTPSPLNEPSISEEKKERILAVIEENGGNINRASVVLGISASSLRRRVAQWAAQESPNTTPESVSPTRRFYEKIANPWRVKSFDPEKREACVEITTRSSVNNLSFTVPTSRFPD